MTQTGGRLINTWQSYIAALVAAAILAFTPLAVVAWLITLYITSRLLFAVPFGFIGRLAVSFLLVSAVTAGIAGAAWLTNVALSATLVLVLLGMLLAGLVVAARSALPPLVVRRAELLNTTDLIALGLAVVFMAVLALPATLRPSSATLAPLIMWGGDNSSHINIFKTNDLNRGFAIGYDNNVNLGGVLATYPQGWHVNAAFLKWTIDPIVQVQSSPVRILAFYYAVCALWFGALVFMLARAGLNLWSAVAADKTRGAPWPHLLVALTTALLVAYGLAPLFAYGFQTQIAALVFLLLEVALIASAYAAQSVRSRYALLLLSGVALMGSSLSWLFLLPVGALLLAGAAAHTWWSTKKLPLFAILLGIPVAAGIAFQPAVQVFVKVPEFQEGILNQRGLTGELNYYLLLALAGMALCLLVMYAKQWRIRIFVAACIVALLFSTAIMIFQLQTIHELRYYYFKSLYTFIVLVAPLLAAGVGLAFGALIQRVKHKRKVAALGGLAVAAGAMLCVALQSPTLYRLTHAKLQGVSPAQAHAVESIIVQNPQDATLITSIGSCNRGDDVRTAQLAHALSYQPNRVPIQYSPNELLFINKHYLFGSMRDFVIQRNSSLIVLVNDQVLGEELKTALGPANDRVRYVMLDTTPETEPLLQCPDRIRALSPDDIRAGLK